jgi:hypothetical protein
VLNICERQRLVGFVFGASCVCVVYASVGINVNRLRPDPVCEILSCCHCRRLSCACCLNRVLNFFWWGRLHLRDLASPCIDSHLTHPLSRGKCEDKEVKVSMDGKYILSRKVSQLNVNSSPFQHSNSVIEWSKGCSTFIGVQLSQSRATLAEIHLRENATSS